MSPDEAFKEIQDLTGQLISTGLCIDQNFPAISHRGDIAEVTFGKDFDLSVTLKNIPYVEAYIALTDSRSYNLKLIDGGLLQFLYTFQKNNLVKHRLAFFPSPDLLEYQNNSEIYETDELYGDVLERNVVTVPLRFDYDPSAHVDYHHPISHLTIGQYKNCRIPVSGGITPFFFVNFILRAFYNTPFRKFCDELRDCKQTFTPTVTDLERRHLYISVHDAI
jgi:hypothetical protein